MDGTVNLPAAEPSDNNRPPININITDSNKHSRPVTSANYSSSSSPPDFLRNVQAAFKRHRPIGKMQTNSIRPVRLLGPQRETSKTSDLNVSSVVDSKKTEGDVSLSQRVRDYVAQTKSMAIGTDAQEDASITPPSICGSVLSTQEEAYKPFGVQDQQKSSAGCKINESGSLLLSESEQVGQKKVQFALGNNGRAQGDDDRATNIGNLLSDLDSLALTEMEWDASNQMEASSAVGEDIKHSNLRSDVQVSYLLAKGTTRAQDQLHQFRNFLQGDLNHQMTQSSVVGSSCPTTTLVNSSSAPVHNSTTYSSNLHQKNSSQVGVESFGACDVNAQPVSQLDNLPPPHSSSKYRPGLLADQLALAAKASSSALDTQLEGKQYGFSKDQKGTEPKGYKTSQDKPPSDGKLTKVKAACVGDVTDVQSQAPLSENRSTDMKPGSSKPEKQEKVPSSKASSAPRKKSHDPEQFFIVNGTKYQRLGKIGSGGSSEVHKVIAQDCKIYALKRIKLKGRDYATAYGFCQEIGYLNKLKGKNNIIQLIDYEVTDEALLKEVLQGSMSNKDRKVSDDGHIFMVLEYGEIDLAHMLSQKWQEMDASNSTLDENWLRFYWQQILLAVKTIHEERIVHSDLKPANFLLVRGSLKLIDFGIAKAIMSDTTNIQRDSQVGTLSYMSPEAFMCNDTDANGNTIKCGRSSDIWSLGCILYQMVYGRTPFSEYKTFWAKYKVITDPNHEIVYEPVPNPWLLDLMKKCLLWNRHERWRIPQLLEHPFLVPPIPPQLSTPQDQSCKFLQLVAESCTEDQKALALCSQLQELLRDPKPEKTYTASKAVDQRRKLLCEMSNLCIQLQEQLANVERH